MRSQRIFCIAALVLMVTSLLAVALDQVIFPGEDHRPGNCPICSWANSLASSMLPALVVLIEVTARSWMAQEPPSTFCDQTPSRLFLARGPPSLCNA